MRIISMSLHTQAELESAFLQWQFQNPQFNFIYNIKSGVHLPLNYYHYKNENENDNRLSTVTAADWM